MADQPELWVRSELMPNGTYGVAINVGDDRAWSLGRDQAVAYAIACITRATQAEHDAAVVGMLTSKGIGLKDAVLVVLNDLWPDRPVDHSATEPLRLWTALGARVGPFIKMDLDGEPAGEMTTADLIDHGTGVLKVLAAADLDAALHRALTGSFGLDDGRARAAIDSLFGHWPASEVRTKPGRPR